jgi:hypothetical protein
MYFTNIGPKSGPILWRDNYHAIGVLQAPDNHMPIGLALPIGRDDDVVEVWRLIVHGVEVPGRWVVVDRAFWPEELAPQPGRGRGRAGDASQS